MTDEPRWRVPLSDVAVDDHLAAAITDTARSGWWSMGPRVAEFENDFAAFCEAPEAVAVASGTAALHLALLATGCGAGDEVILPSLNFVAAANMVVMVGATPVFCDIYGEHDLNLDPEDLEAAVGPATKAVIGLDYGGFPMDAQRVAQVAERHGLVTIEDAAHAPGSSYRGRMCGTLGDIGCFSFFANKNLPLGEGGMIVTKDEDLARKVRMLRSHGMTSLTWDRHRGHAHGYDVLDSGFNYRLDEIRATIGITLLRRLHQANAQRGALSALYRELFTGPNSSISMPFAGTIPGGSSAHHLAVVLLPEGTDRTRVQEQMRSRLIQTSVHYPPIHRFTAYRAMAGSRPLPKTDAVADRLLTLPLFPHMREDQVLEVVESLLQAVRSG